LSTTAYTKEEQERKVWAANLYRDLQAMKYAPRNAALKRYFGAKSELSYEWKVSLVSRAFREREALNWGLENLEGVLLTRIIGWMSDKITPKMVTSHLIKNKNFNAEVLEWTLGIETDESSNGVKKSRDILFVNKNAREETITSADYKLFTDELLLLLFEQAEKGLTTESVVANKAKEFYGIPQEMPVSWVRKTLGIE
jgi:hypothetical protein